MNSSSVERLIKALRAAGVSYFKSEEIEVRFGAVESQPLAASGSPEVPAKVPRRTGPKTYAKPPQEQANESNLQKPRSTNAGDVPIKEIEIPHQLNEMVSVLKMSHEELVDRIFPMDAPPDEAFGGF